MKDNKKLEDENLDKASGGVGIIDFSGATVEFLPKFEKGTKVKYKNVECTVKDYKKVNETTFTYTLEYIQGNVHAFYITGCYTDIPENEIDYIR